jgi:glycosyltransferase involved in cell wall biosynthesis
VINVENHRRYSEFSHSYADPAMERLFDRILQAERPDVVHFQHLLHHSTNYAAIARMHGIPTVMTLHEYWLLCARNGQLFDAKDERCTGPGLEKCAQCMSRFMWGRSKVDLWMLRGIHGVRKLTGMNFKAKARRVRLRKVSDDDFVPSDRRLEDMRKNLLMREACVRDLIDNVDCLIAPSEFLRDRFLEFGVDAERIVMSDYGTELRDFRNITRAPQSEGPLRVGFMGSLQPVKGAHVLLAALRHLEPNNFEVEIYGDVEAKPEYVQEISEEMSDRVKFKGNAPAQDVPRILSSFDVLVMPSIWWENSPLIIHEAFAAGIPVICSNVGGMSELVEHGVSGLNFEVESPESLADCLRSLQQDRNLLNQLRQGVPKLKDMKTDAAFHDQLFEAVLEHYEEMRAAAELEEEDDLFTDLANEDESSEDQEN